MVCYGQPGNAAASRADLCSISRPFLREPTVVGDFVDRLYCHTGLMKMLRLADTICNQGTHYRNRKVSDDGKQSEQP